jgi:anti-sigma B factor antagonist
MMLRMSTRLLDGIVVLDCEGRIVFGDETEALHNTIKSLLNETRQIVLNLGGVSYIDSGGLGTLVALYTSARSTGGSIKLANLTQRVGDVLQVTKLLTVFDVYDGEELAVRAFRRGATAA